MLELIHLTNMEKSLKSQYQNATNISARINLHTLYAQNTQGWFPWIYQQCGLRSGMRASSSDAERSAVDGEPGVHTGRHPGDHV